jgi:hypothetical protein
MTKLSEPTGVARRARTRNPFPGQTWFAVPCELVDGGYLKHMRGSEVKRVLALYRRSNFEYGKRQIQIGNTELERLDGVSVRNAWMVNTKLDEYQIVSLTRSRPSRFELLPTSMWADSKSPLWARRQRRPHRPRKTKQPEIQKIEPPSWEDIGSKCEQHDLVDSLQTNDTQDAEV